MSFAVTFWGTRGSIACPTPRHLKYGGNTSCVQIQAGESHIILDAGTGIRELGHWHVKKGIQQASLLLTHTHWDHINGFPFFPPAFMEDYELLVMAGHLRDAGGVRTALEGQMTQPMFPVPLETMRARISFEDFEAGDHFNLDGGIEVKTAPLHHPSGATGYQITYDGTTLCYVTDTEHIIGKLDRNILGLIENTDLVIYDSTYTDEVFEKKRGWGHSTWQEGIRLCREASAERLAIFHHDPDHPDDVMERIEEESKQTWEGAFVAREGMRLVLA